MTNEATASEGAAVGEQGVPKGQKTAKAAEPATTKDTAMKKPKAASKKAAKARAEAKIQHAGSKKQIVLDLLRRKHGATLAEIMEQTGWKAPTVRGFISASLRKNMGLVVAPTKSEAGGRTYRIGK
jgi:hypothetical protein